MGFTPTPAYMRIYAAGSGMMDRVAFFAIMQFWDETTIVPDSVCATSIIIFVAAYDGAQGLPVAKVSPLECHVEVE